MAFAVSEDERRELRKRWLSIAYGLALIFAVLSFSPAHITGLIRYAPHFAAIGGPIYHAFVAFASVCAGLGIVIAFRNFRLAVGRRKNQLAYFLVAAVILGMSPLLHFGGYYFKSEPLPHDLLVPIFVIIMTYAILRHQLIDIRLVFRRSLVYSLLVTCITSIYLVMVLIMEKWFQGFLGYRSVFATGVVAFLIAIFFNPLRNRIQALVDRYFFHGTQIALAEENERLRRELTNTEKLKAVAALAAGLAHELKNPLASLKTFVEYLPDKYGDPAYREKFSRIVGQEVGQMNTLVQQLLEFARPSPPQRQPVKLSRLIDETVGFLHGALLKKRIEVARAYTGQDELSVDPGQIKQVFLNLFLNSIEAMERPGCISVTTVSENGHVEILVADTGPGIAKKDLPHVFDPFYTTKASGTGLGLSVVHSIVREHGGRVTVDSNVGRGTTVRIQLPVNGDGHS